MSFKEVRKGVVKRTQRRELGLFIDGTGLDRATRRIKRKVDIPSLVRGVTAGTIPVVARYYTLVPHEDDARQHAFLDAVRRANVRVVVKRLPPKGVTRQVAIDVEMAADIVAFALGHSQFSSLSEYQADDNRREKNSQTIGMMPPSPWDRARTQSDTNIKEAVDVQEKPVTSGNVKRIVTVVCPSRDLAYPISLAGELGIDTVTADFAHLNNRDVLKSAAKWIDLSDSETIWRD